MQRTDPDRVTPVPVGPVLARLATGGLRRIAAGIGRRTKRACLGCRVAVLCVVLSSVLLSLADPVWAVPRGGSVAGNVGVGIAPRPAPRTGEVLDCPSLWAAGTPLKDTGTVLCVEYASTTIGGADYRVFYPAEWQPAGGWGTDYLDTAVAAVEHTVPVFAQFGTMASANVVFARLDPHGDYAEGALTQHISDEPCAVVIYPTASELTEAQFSQTIAHELFHCFQFWNFPDQAGGQASAWWVEGTAEYFSNVAYPAVNLEWRWAPGFDQRSYGEPLTQLSYENVLFFQYLGNTIGDAGILDLIAALPSAGGEAEQQAALAAYPGFADLFQGFAEAYLDGTIVDTGGQTIPGKPQPGPIAAVDENNGIRYFPRPFVVERLELRFSPGPRFLVEVEVSGGPSRTAAEPLGTTGAWGNLPAAIDCAMPRRYRMAATSTAVMVEGGVLIRITTTRATPECDEPPPADQSATPSAERPAAPCLIGTWAVADFADYLAASLAATGEEGAVFAPLGESGSLTYDFSATEVTVVADGYEQQFSTTIDGVERVVTVRIDGTATAPYRVEPGGQVVVEEAAGRIAVTEEIPDSEDPNLVYSQSVNGFLPILGDVLACLCVVDHGGEFAYACDGDALTITEDGKPPLTLTRVP